MSCLWTIEEVGGKPRLHFAFCCFILCYVFIIFSCLFIRRFHIFLFISISLLLLICFSIFIIYLFLYRYHVVLSLIYHYLTLLSVFFYIVIRFSCIFLYRYYIFLSVPVLLSYFLIQSLVITAFSYHFFNCSSTSISFLFNLSNLDNRASDFLFIVFSYISGSKHTFKI